MKIQHLLFLNLFLLLFSCNKKFIAPQPTEFYNPAEIVKEPSSLNIIASLPVKELQKQLNAQVPELLYEDNKLEDDNYILKVWRKGDIQMVPNGQLIAFKIPLKIYAKARLKLDQFGIQIQQDKEANFELNVNYLTKISAKTDWKITTQTSSNGYDWITKPIVNLGILEFNVAPFLEKILDEQQDIIAKEIDKQIVDKVSIKEHVQKAWDAIQTPFSVSDEYNAWVKISPKEVFFMPPTGNQDKIDVGIGVKGIAETFIGKKPDASPVPLPELKIAQQPTNEFAINLITQVSLDLASKLAKQNFKDKIFNLDDGKKTIKVEDIELFGSGEKLIIKAELSGSFSGIIFLSGNPFYDTTAKAIKVRNMDFELNTKSRLLKTANWIAHDYFVKKLQGYFTFPVQDQINEAKTMISKTLTNNKVNSYLTLNGEINDIIPRKMYLVQDYFLVLIEARGKLNMNISGF